MNPKFQADVQERDHITFVRLAGVIDEDNDLGALADRLHSGTTVLNVSEIERINSCGVRDWVNCVSKAEKNGAHIVLIECSPAIVAQINLVNNFTGQGVVKSFFAPYFCPNCDLEKVLLVETRDMAGAQPFRAPTCRCDECDGPMEFDDMEESYFAFLGNAKKLHADADVDAAMRDLGPSDGRKVRSRTVGAPTAVGQSKSGQVSMTSLPSVPSLPHMTRTTGGGSSGSGSGPIGTGTHVTPSGVRQLNGFGPASPSGVRSAAALAELEARRAQQSPTMEPSRGDTRWVVIGGILVVAVIMLGYVVFSGRL